MRKIIVGPQADIIVREFMCLTLQNPSGFVGGRGLGMIKLVNENDAQVLAGVWYENFNGANMMMHIATDGSRQWMTKEYLWYAFFYPFVECGCKRVTALVAASNTESRTFVERIGFELEAVLKDAAVDGNMHVYCMFRQDCRWLKICERGVIHRRMH